MSKYTLKQSYLDGEWFDIGNFKKLKDAINTAHSLRAMPMNKYTSFKIIETKTDLVKFIRTGEEGPKPTKELFDEFLAGTVFEYEGKGSPLVSTNKDLAEFIGGPLDGANPYNLTSDEKITANTFNKSLPDGSFHKYISVGMDLNLIYKGVGNDEVDITRGNKEEI